MITVICPSAQVSKPKPPCFGLGRSFMSPKHALIGTGSDVDDLFSLIHTSVPWFFLALSGPLGDDDDGSATSTVAR